MISISINAQSAEEAQHAMLTLLAGTSAPVMMNVTTAGTVSTESASEVAAAAKRPSGRTRAAAADKAATQAISTGEERVDPEADKQDAVDEAADTKASELAKLSHDSVRSLLGGYVQAYGMAAAQEDGAKMIGIPKISELKDDQAVLAKAVLAIGSGIESNPYKREMVGDGITAEKIAELKPIIAAAKAVK
jgi:hypothetical protein